MVRLFVILFALFLSGCGSLQQENTMKEYDVTIPVTEAVVPSESGITERPELLSPLVQPENEDFVRVKDYIPEIYTELKYAGEDNFTGQKIYGFDDIFLRYGTVMKLKAVSDEVNQQGYYLKLWDGFRPVSAQYKLWEICPDPEYVANPNKGYSNHSRGFAVDLTLVDRQGREVVMPTGFDDFSSQADRDYSDCLPEAADNARFLEAVMERNGFKGYRGEWWHFNDNQTYDVETCFDPAIICRMRVTEDCVLLKNIWNSADNVLTIPAQTDVTLLGYLEEYAMVEYWGYRGYIPSSIITTE